MQLFNYYEEDQDLLEDVLTENQQAIQMTSIATEILSRHDGRLRLDHLQQPQRRHESPGRAHHHPQPAGHRRCFLRHERRSAGEDHPLTHS
ncbi:MAG: hypothetical protein M0C28_44200 [Candidatus Moduliflexus flocculans]|nr:hypothetical protein [Candidatus Moduliflexus flocculans]